VPPDEEIRRLYGLPLERFTPERTELVKRLKAEGEPDAAEVAGLRKPSLPAWAVNQLVRERTPQLEDLWKAADKLREAHAGRGDFAAALEAERGALDRLAASARELLERRGHAATDATLQRVRGTLQAAAADPETRSAVEQGRLVEPVEPTGFGALAGLAPAPRRAPKRDDRKEKEERRRRIREAETALREAQRRAEQLRREVEKAEAEVEAAEQELRRAKGD
jgi:DNA repair exonuclease SbcCD ATPase subunit